MVSVSTERGEMNMTLDAQPKVLTARETASFLGLAESTLAKWRCTGDGPQYLKLGKSVKYRLIDLNAWLEDQAGAHTSV